MKLKRTDLIGDCLYQTNLVLWMLQPSTGIVVKPVLRDAGFRLHSVEPVLRLPLSLINRLTNDRIEHHAAPSPDALVTVDDTQFVIIECKRNLFGSKPHNGKSSPAQKQARSLLLQSPDVLASAINHPPDRVTSVQVVYIATKQPRQDHTAGLLRIREELHKKGYNVVHVGVLTLSAEGRWVMLNVSDLKDGVPGTVRRRLTSARGKLRVHALEGDVDPRPLYPIPWMPGSSHDCTDEYPRRAFGNRILSQVALRIGPGRPPCKIHLDLEEVLTGATSGLWKHWENDNDKNGLRRTARRLIRATVKKALIGESQSVLQDGQGSTLHFDLPDRELQSKVVEALRNDINVDWNNDPQMEMFPEDN